MLNCPRCGVTNLPYAIDCIVCNRTVQDKADAEAKRMEWDALSPALREEQEKAFDRMRESVLNHVRWLRKHRTTHALIGALVVCLLMNMAVFFALGWPLAID